MAADPISFLAGQWLGAASGVLALLTAYGFISRWGNRFRLVGVTSFTALLALSCLAFSVSYVPRVSVKGAARAPVVFDNGGDLVIAAAPQDLAPAAIMPTVEQLARNLRAGGRTSPDGRVHVRLRALQEAGDGAARPVVLAEASVDLASGSISLQERP